MNNDFIQFDFDYDINNQYPSNPCGEITLDDSDFCWLGGKEIFTSEEFIKEDEMTIN